MYNDAGWEPTQRPLVASRYHLIGKPDYLVQTVGGLVPVEVKPSRRTSRPYEGDLMQLAAYCLLVEATTNTPPPYGLLRYAGQTFRMPYTAAVRSELLAVLQAIVDDRSAEDVRRSHEQEARCRGCGFVATCADSLV